MMYEDINETLDRRINTECYRIANERIPPKAIKPIPARATLYDSLTRAKKALAAQKMSAEDARAWLDLDDIQLELLRPR